MNSGGIELRRIPKQKRSRERYERVLQAARLLIAERGNDGVSMRQIAEASEVPIGSVYQYFPDKNTVLWTLMADHFDELESQFLKELGQVTEVGGLRELSIKLFDQFVGLCRNDPCFSRLWRSVQANSVLAELDQALNERIASAFQSKLAELGVKDANNEIWTSSFLMASLASTALQLAFSNDERREMLLEAFRQLLKAQFQVSNFIENN